MLARAGSYSVVMLTLPVSPVAVDARSSVRASVELAAGMFDARPSGHVGGWDDPIARLYGALPAIANTQLVDRFRDTDKISAARRRSAVRHFVSVGPSVLSVRSGKPREWETSESETWDVDDHRFRRQAVVEGLLTRADLQAQRVPARSSITRWSPKSRRNMLRSLASYDWSPIFESKHPRALLTLTYGSDWFAQAPSAAVSKAHLRAFREAYIRDVGPAYGSWKLEFQARGAPHYHLMMLAPHWLRVAGQRVSFVDWLSATWARIVGADNTVVGSDGRTEFTRHLSAGTNVDWGFGARCTSAMSLAAYMMKHNAPGGFSKEYQHDVPAEWSADVALGVKAPEPGCEGPSCVLDGAVQWGHGPGRFWGVWVLERCVEQVEVSPDDAVEVLRLLRRLAVARGGRSRECRRRRVDRRTGVIRYRTVRVPYAVGARRRRWLLAGDGPALACSIARALRDPDPWPAGLRRPLP